MPISESIEFLGSLLLSYLSSYLICLLSWPFRNWYCFLAQISPDIQSSGWHKVYEDYYIQECWPRKETCSWWCLIIFGGWEEYFSPTVACSNALQVLETHWVCRIHHCTFTHQVFVVIHTVKRGSMICWEAYLDQESKAGS